MSEIAPTIDGFSKQGLKLNRALVRKIEQTLKSRIRMGKVTENQLEQLERLGDFEYLSDEEQLELIDSNPEDADKYMKEEKHHKAGLREIGLTSEEFRQVKEAKRIFLTKRQEAYDALKARRGEGQEQNKAVSFLYSNEELIHAKEEIELEIMLEKKVLNAIGSYNGFVTELTKYNYHSIPRDPDSRGAQQSVKWGELVVMIVDTAEQITEVIEEMEGNTFLLDLIKKAREGYYRSDFPAIVFIDIMASAVKSSLNTDELARSFVEKELAPSDPPDSRLYKRDVLNDSLSRHQLAMDDAENDEDGELVAA